MTSDCHRLELPSPPNCHRVHCCFVRVTILFLVFRFHPASPKTSLVVKSIPLPLERMGLEEASHLQVITPPNFRLPGSQAGSVCCSLKPKSPIITSFQPRNQVISDFFFKLCYDYFSKMRYKVSCRSRARFNQFCSVVDLMRNPGNPTAPRSDTYCQWKAILKSQILKLKNFNFVQNIWTE